MLGFVKFHRNLNSMESSLAITFPFEGLSLHKDVAYVVMNE